MLTRGCCLGMSMLLVITPLIPSEAVGISSSGVVLVVLWLVLALFMALRYAIRPQWHGSPWIDVCVWLLVSTQVISGIAQGPNGSMRPVINLIWQWVALGLSFTIIRQLAFDPLVRRSLIAVSIALAATLSVFGFYEYAVAKPRLREQFRNDPDGTLEQAGVFAPAGSPQRKQFKDRLDSKEPIATFALTNSFAGFLLPWMIVAAGILLSRPGRRAYLIAIALALIGACLLLTKSRTAYLSAAAGVSFLAISWWGSGRLGRLGVGLSIAACLAIVVVVVAVGGLDPQVLSEAPLSMRYRVEYWNSTWQMILDHPVLGVAPGNFKAFYTSYKLPQASETVADPHNFLLEVWATSGTLGLLALIGVIGVSIWNWRKSPAVAKPALSISDAIPVFAGAAVGLFAAFPIGLMVGFFPDPMILLLGLVCGPLVVAALYPWILTGNLPRTAVVAGLVALGINLLAAGGWSFVAVAQSGWLLLAVAWSYEGRATQRHARWGWLALATLVAAVVVSYVTYYDPVMRAPMLLDQANAQPVFARAETTLIEAADVDPWSPDAAMTLAHLRWLRWNQTRQDSHWTAYLEAVELARDRDRRSTTMNRQIGDWNLAAYQAVPSAAQQQAMLEAYRRSLDLYPNSNLMHAQFAWANHLAGNAAEAKKHADQALKLDARVPHTELQLRNQALAGTPEKPPMQSAEQLMRQIRNGLE